MVPPPALLVVERVLAVLQDVNHRVGRAHRRSCPSLECFRTEFMAQHEPLVLTDCVEHWPAVSASGHRAWTVDYIKRVAGPRTVPIEIGSKYTDSDWGQKLMTVSDFIDQYILNSHQLGYLAQHQLFDQIPELRNDICIPDYCCLGENDHETVDINAWFGPEGTVSPLHYDPKHNFLVQVMGRKYIRLYKEEYTECVYPHPDRLLFNTSQVDVENPDLVKFPRFQDADGHCVECVLKPGEMLYIPPRCWHYVRSLAVSFSVSFWWQ